MGKLGRITMSIGMLSLPLIAETKQMSLKDVVVSNYHTVKALENRVEKLEKGGGVVSDTTSDKTVDALKAKIAFLKQKVDALQQTVERQKASITLDPEIVEYTKDAQ